MIYTLTLNPALDYVVHPDTLIPGKISRSRNERIFYGGKGINISLVLRELGIESVATGFIAGFTGNELVRMLSEEVRCEFIRLESGMTRINVKIRDGLETDINASGPRVTEKDVQRLYDRLDMLEQGDMLILAGSVPQNLSAFTYSYIMDRLSRKGVSFVVDAAGELLTNALPYKPFLIKPNIEELGEIFGVDIYGADEAAVYALALQKMGAKNVLVSMGENGAVLLAESGEFYNAPVFRGKVINTVGAGDSMLAAFIAMYSSTYDLRHSLDFSAAAGSAAAFSEALPKESDIYALYEQLSDLSM